MKCPHCQHDIEGSGYWEFFNCPQCNASLQMEEGKAQLLQAPEAQPAHTPETPSNTSSTPAKQTPPPESAVETSEPLHTSAENVNPPLQSTAETDESPGISADNPVPPEFEPTVEPETEQNPHVSDTEPQKIPPSTNAEPPPHSKNNILEFQNPENQDSLQDSLQESENNMNDPSKPETVDHPESPSEDLSSLNDFGDAPLQENQCMYELKISGIHSSQSLSQVKSTLETKTLKLDSANLLSQLKEGCLTIPNLNPIQTIYIVKCLSTFNVQLHWIQKS